MELTLQFKGSLAPILTGDQVEEHRLIYPRNWQQYVSGDYYGDPIHYDSLKLINGRLHNAPWCRVAVKSEEVVVLTDEDGNDLTYEQDGVEYLKLMMVYHLGDILEVGGTIGGIPRTIWGKEPPKQLTINL